MKKNLNQRAFSLIEISIVILIIGILIAGVTQSSRLVTQAKTNSARTLTESSPVSSVKNLSLWVESTAEASFDYAETDDSSTITNWYDINPQASNKAHLTQATTANKPTYKLKIINSLPAVKFDGTTDFMTSANFSNITTGAITAFAVVKLPSTLAAQTIFDKSSTGQVNFRLNTAASGTGWQYLDAAGTYGGSATVAASGTYIVSIVYNANSASGGGTTTSTGMSFFQNGAAVGQVAASSSPSTSAANQFTLGRDSGSVTFFGGHVGELIIYDRSIKREERQAIEEYLGKKWGIIVATAAY